MYILYIYMYISGVDTIVGEKMRICFSHFLRLQSIKMYHKAPCRNPFLIAIPGVRGALCCQVGGGNWGEAQFAISLAAERRV